jgi:DNA-binding transcriptional ArsR family regulator
MADGLQLEMEQFESTERTHRKRAAGNIFAIDKRAWAAACSLGMNAAVAYLVLARGTGGDQRTVGWSVNAIENKTGIGRPNARKAIERLIAAGLVRKDRGGTKPRYYLTPAHELLGAVSRRRTNLTPDELRVLAAIRDGHRRPPRTKGGEIWGPLCRRDGARARRFGPQSWQS